jgi:dsRNA-specific ribonuclease
MVGFFVMSGIRIAPGYVEYLTIRDTVIRVAEEYDREEDTIADIRRALSPATSTPTRSKESDYKDVEIERREGDIFIDASYEQRIPLVWRIDAVVKYDDLVFEAGVPRATDGVDDQQWLQRAHFGCRLDDGALLTQALTHRSVGSRNNERLEFLGDAVLGYVISAELYRRFPEADEGQLSRLRVSLVKGSALADWRGSWTSVRQLRLGRGTQRWGRHRRSILADTLEAVIGAIALDRGIEECRRCVLNIFAAGCRPESE